MSSAFLYPVFRMRPIGRIAVHRSFPRQSESVFSPAKSIASFRGSPRLVIRLAGVKVKLPESVKHPLGRNPVVGLAFTWLLVPESVLFICQISLTP